MYIAGLEALVGLGALATLALLVAALVDLVKRPAEAWAISGHSQLVWAIVVIFVGFIGPVLYLLVARPALEATSTHPAASGW